MDNDINENTISETDHTENAESWKPQDADKEFVKQQIRNRVRNAVVSDNTVFIPAKPDPTITDNEHKTVAVYARVSTLSTEQVSSIENQTRYYTEKIEKNPNWTIQEIYSDEGKSGTSMRKRTEFLRMIEDAKEKKMDLILCASVSRFARNVSDCMEQIRILKTQNPNHPVGVYFETENIYTLDPGSHQALSMHAMLADWESANKSRRMILSYDQRICMGQYPVSDLLGYRHTKDGQLIINEEEAKTVRYIFLSFLNGDSYEQIAETLTEKKRPTLKGRTEWNGAMVCSIMNNERRWGDLKARKTIVIDYVKGKTVKNDRIRDAAFVSGHHEGIVSPEIARAAHLIMSSNHGYEGGVSEAAVITSGALKGFVSISPQWAGMDIDSLTVICKSAYSDDELEKIEHESKIQSGEEHSKVLSMEFNGYQVPNGVFFLNNSMPALTISPRSIKFNKAAHRKINSEYVEFLFHPILKTVALRSCDESALNAFPLNSSTSKTTKISATAFCQAIYDKMDWIKKYRFRFRGIARCREGAGIMMFYLDEPQILADKATREKYESEGKQPAVCYIPYRNCELSDENPNCNQTAGFGITMAMRKRRDALMNDIRKSDIETSSIAVINPKIGIIPTKEEVREELDNLLLSM